jgi:hypothetical protein
MFGLPVSHMEYRTEVFKLGTSMHAQRVDHRMQRDSLQEILDKVLRPADTKSSSHPTLCFSRCWPGIADGDLSTARVTRVVPV